MAASALGPLPASAQDRWPSRPIRLVVPFTPGGVTDTSGRVVAEFLSRRLGQQVIVDNKPGASGNIGMALVKEAQADGYTLALAFDGTMVINPHVFPKVPFDTLPPRPVERRHERPVEEHQFGHGRGLGGTGHLFGDRP